jgi:hypothetical protein
MHNLALFFGRNLCKTSTKLGATQFDTPEHSTPDDLLYAKQTKVDLSVSSRVEAQTGNELAEPIDLSNKICRRTPISEQTHGVLLRFMKSGSQSCVIGK